MTLDFTCQKCEGTFEVDAQDLHAAVDVLGVGADRRHHRHDHEVGAEHLPIIVDAVERALAPLAAPDGHVSLNGSTWIVSATNPT